MNYLFVEGPANVGKSTFLRALCSRLLVSHLYEVVDCEEVNSLDNFRYLLHKCNTDNDDEYIIINSPTDDYGYIDNLGIYITKHSSKNIKTIITSIRCCDGIKNRRLHAYTRTVLGVSSMDICETISLSGLRNFNLI